MVKLIISQMTLLVSLIVGFASDAYSSDKTPLKSPQILHGTVDLSDWDFDRDGAAQLEGDWLFFWRRALEVSEMAALLKSASEDQVYAKVPGSFLESSTDISRQTPPSMIGYGSYLLKVKAPRKPFRQLGLSAVDGYSSTAITLFSAAAGGGRAVRFNVGNPGKESATAIPMIKTLRAQPLPFDPGQDFYILIQVSNFHWPWGGLRGAPKLAEYATLYEQDAAVNNRDLVVAGTILALAFYNLTLFLRRRQDYASLNLSIACFGFAARSLVWYLFPEASELNFEIVWKIQYITVLFCALFLGFFLAQNFRDTISTKFVQISAPVIAVYIGFVLVTPAMTYVPTLSVAQVILAVLMTYLLVGIIRAAILCEPGSYISLAGGFLVVTGAILDMLRTQELIHIPMGSAQFGMVGFLFCQSQIVGIRFAQAFRDSESLNQKLREQERARTLFFHNTSHELRTPLNGILGFLDLMEKGHFGDRLEDLRGYILKVKRLTESLKLQVNTILDLAKARRGELKLQCTQFCLNELVEEAALLVDGLLAKSGKLRFKTQLSWETDKSPMFIGDRDKISTILRNLVGNACKFTRPGEENCVVLQLDHQPGKGLTISVTDTGIGIPAEHQPHLFKEFGQLEQNARRRYEGTGLGLAMAKNFVDLMGGRISVQSQVAVGSTFAAQIPERERVDIMDSPLPAAAAPAMIPSHDAESPSNRTESANLLTSDQQASLCILVVDDNEINCEVVRETLAVYGYQAETATGGAEALVKMQRKPPDLLLLDLMMPEISGEDVLRSMRDDDNLREIPVILLTARASQEDRILGLEMGADDYLAKPFDSGELAFRVRNTLKRIEITRLRELLCSREKMAKIGDMMAELSHELKNANVFGREESKRERQMIAEILNKLPYPQPAWSEIVACLLEKTHDFKLFSENIGWMAMPTHTDPDRSKQLKAIMTLIGGYPVDRSMFEQVWAAILRTPADQLEDLARMLTVFSKFVVLENSSKSSYQILNSLSSYSRESNEIKACDINEIIGNCLNLLTARIRSGKIKIKNSVSTGHLVLCNRSELQQVVLNVIINAHDALIASQTREKVLALESHIQDDQILCRFTDNGGGIAAENLPRLFERNFTTKGEKGSGIGLYVSRKLARKSGGDLTVATADGNTCFSLSLKRAL